MSLVDVANGKLFYVVFFVVVGFFYGAFPVHLIVGSHQAGGQSWCGRNLFKMTVFGWVFFYFVSLKAIWVLVRFKESFENLNSSRCNSG